MSPTGRVEVIINRVRASAAGPSPQHALREALARFGGLEDIVLLPDDAATADACLLRGCAVLEGAPTSALGKALSALVDRIDPQAAAARKARSPRRSLLRRSKKRGGHRDPADQVPSTRGRNRSTARSAGARRRRKGGGGGRAVGERLPAPQAPGGPARTSQQPLQAPPPAIQPVNQPVNHPLGGRRDRPRAALRSFHRLSHRHRLSRRHRLRDRSPVHRAGPRRRRGPVRGGHRVREAPQERCEARRPAAPRAGTTIGARVTLRRCHREPGDTATEVGGCEGGAGAQAPCASREAECGGRAD